MPILATYLHIPSQLLLFHFNYFELTQIIRIKACAAYIIQIIIILNSTKYYHYIDYY